MDDDYLHNLKNTLQIIICDKSSKVEPEQFRRLLDGYLSSIGRKLFQEYMDKWHLKNGDEK